MNPSIQLVDMLIHGWNSAMGGILIVTATMKAMMPGHWRETLISYQLIGNQRAIHLLATLAIATEFAIGIALVTQVWPVPATLAAFVLFMTMSSVVGLTLIRGRKPKCGCLGHLSTSSVGVSTFARLLIFMSITGGALSVSSHSSWPPAWENFGQWLPRLLTGSMVGIPLGLLLLVSMMLSKDVRSLSASVSVKRSLFVNGNYTPADNGRDLHA